MSINIRDEFDETVKAYNDREKKKAREEQKLIELKSDERDYIREFDSKLERVQGILDRLEGEGVETRRLREKMEEKLRNLTWSLKR